MWKTANIEGTRDDAKKTGSLVYGTPGATDSWTITYFFGPEVACITFNKAAYGSSGEGKACWDRTEKCNQRLEQQPGDSADTVTFKNSYNMRPIKTKAGGGICNWEDGGSHPPSTGSINIFTGDGTYTDRSMPGQKAKIWTIKDFKVTSIVTEA